MPWDIKPPEVNIGVVGHVDHGKTTLVQALTGVWTAKHSMELERGMTIKLGYADGNIAYCDGMPTPDAYTTKEQCPDGSESRLIRRVSYVDAPGHESYMTTMLSGAMIMDGAILVIAANEPCPQPQTVEHLMALNILGIRNIVIVQNKIDVVDKKRALENYNEILKLVKGTVAENAPVIPVSALHNVNIDALLQAIEETIPTPERDYSKPPLMYVVRSFDVNKPGTPYDKIEGGVIGGTLLQGKFRVGDEVTILPGMRVQVGGAKSQTFKYEPVTTSIEEIRYGNLVVEEAKPGGLVALQTKLDPSLTKGDQLVGSVVTRPGNEIPVVKTLEVRYQLFERIVGARELVKLPPLQANEKIAVAIGAASRVAVVKSVRKDVMTIELTDPVATWSGSRIAISRRVLARWRLAGWGIIEGVSE
ncbi:translation initiation factor IF-2 subunit gamma [Desulfurococcus mucosus]|uniref:protein-synthesizing GTPase n=1 Tax=Desulfurococcus mucosus (strain ATCC 35584 / DSM 2162 / JCM 9187 / O7/1) TaxID=765177 RepID=E8R7G8_DESM0|nr:translation initiation factor IF-2 subunit gamma [Desulfurococcus mucosus]ADV65633.1 translation initiation factor 2 subunit gamma (aeIF-2g) [Desulfurococcus mucosus DSM 2162]